MFSIFPLFLSQNFLFLKYFLKFLWKIIFHIVFPCSVMKKLQFSNLVLIKTPWKFKAFSKNDRAVTHLVTDQGQRCLTFLIRFTALSNSYVEPAVRVRILGNTNFFFSLQTQHKEKKAHFGFQINYASITPVRDLSCAQCFFIFLKTLHLGRAVMKFFSFAVFVCVSYHLRFLFVFFIISGFFWNSRTSAMLKKNSTFLTCEWI